MMMNEKAMYVSPQIEVIRLEVEGVIAGSGKLPQLGDGGSAYTRSGSSSTRSYNGASSSELEDLINDILTIEQ